MQTKTFPTKTELGSAVARHVLDAILRTERDRFILGVPTGATPMPFLEAFLAFAKELPKADRARIAKKLYLVVMDDFVDPASRTNIAAADERNAVGFVRTYFLNELEKTVSSPGMADRRILFPRPGEVGALTKEIIDRGGLDLQIIATDPYEGHVAQNFPGEPFKKTEAAKCARLSDAFIKHHAWAAQYYGVTFGLDDFMDMVAANRQGQFLLMLWGEAKHPILQRLLDSRDYNPQLPLSFLWLAREKTSVFTDYQLANNRPMP